MEKENKTSTCGHEKVIVKNQHYNHGGSGAIYGLGVIGALFYFLQNATTLGLVVIGIGKSIFWPALLMFRLLTLLKM